MNSVPRWTWWFRFAERFISDAV